MKDMKGGLQQLQHQQQQQQQQQAPQQQPQKCPRCDSLNTKFCYYNNYSLSQPRYFCKTCRRYWTQGGTLRNVPVGGGCRKGKRSNKPSSSSSLSTTSSSSTATISNTTTTTTDGHHHHHHINHQILGSNMGKGIEGISQSSQFFMPPPPPPPMYYPSGGFLSSLAAFQSFNQGSVGGDQQFVGGSNLALLQGFSAMVPSFVTQQQQQVFSLEGSMIDQSSNRPSNEDWISSSTTQHHQGFNRNGSTGHDHEHEQQTHIGYNWGSSTSITSTTNPTKTTSATMAAASTSTTATTTTTTSAAAVVGDRTSGGPPVNPITLHHWSDLPGFGPLPTPSTSSSPSFL